MDEGPASLQPSYPGSPCYFGLFDGGGDSVRLCFNLQTHNPRLNDDYRWSSTLERFGEK